MSKNTPENKAKALVKFAIDEAKGRYNIESKMVWNAGASFGEATVDATGVIGGFAVAIEVKRFDGKGKFSGRQDLFLKEWAAAGGWSFLIEDQSSLERFVHWMHLTFVGGRK